MNHVHTYDTGVRWQMMGPPYLWIEIWCQCGASRLFRHFFGNSIIELDSLGRESKVK
jgi:hypothetical protein